jgi:hypothetical protein
MTPFDLCMAQLVYRISTKHHYFDEPIVLVVGESFEDFCLYFSLSRLRHDVAWLPSCWLELFDRAYRRASGGGTKISEDELYAGYLSSSLWKRARSNQADKQIAVVSMSGASEQLKEWSRILIQASEVIGAGIEDRMTVQSSISGLTTWPLKVFGRENVSLSTFEQFEGSEMAAPLDSPKPKGFTNIDTGAHRWITEVYARGHAMPRHPKLGPHCIRYGSSMEINSRSGVDGLCYFCPNIAIFSNEIDMVLIKPSVVFPDGLELFEFLAEKAEMQCRLSDKGYFLAQTIDKFHGLAELGEFLRKTQHRNLFDKFLDAKEAVAGNQDEGIYLKSDRRRYLDFQSIQKLVGWEVKDVGALIDRLVADGVFYRGVVLKCGYCRNADWFSLGEIDQAFQCKRCSKLQVYGSYHALGKAEPTWYYKLDEIVYQGYLNNMAVPALALHALSGKKQESFFHSTELEFWNMKSQKRIGESDICCVLDGKLCIGEAKKIGELGANGAEDRKVATKYQELAQALGARLVVFATFAQSWSERTLGEVATVFSNSSVSVEMLKQDDLL